MSDTYHKIQTVYMRDPATSHKTLLDGQYSLPEFAYLADNEWTWTEKVDGTNIRVMGSLGRVSFGGKTDAAQIPAKLVEVLRNTFTEDGCGIAFPPTVDFCLYGEGYGAGIQKGGNYRPDQSFVLFDVLIAGRWWLNREDVEDVARKLGIDVVPIIGHGTLAEMVERTREGFPSLWNSSHLAEGIVARPAVELFSRKGERIITKIKHADFRG